MKTLTKEWFKKQKACEDGYKWVLGRKDITIRGTLKELLNINRFDWASWTMARLLNKKQKIQYAIFAAEQVIDIYKKEHPNDDRPRKAINAAKAVLKKNTKANRDAANAAAYASAAYANAAAHAAHAAAHAAYAAAAYAAAAYANAAAHAAHATNAAAHATNAANAAAKKEMQIIILEHGMKLLGG